MTAGALALPAAAPTERPAGEVEAVAAELLRGGADLRPWLPAVATLDTQQDAANAAAVLMGEAPLRFAAAEVAAERWQCVRDLERLAKRAGKLEDQADRLGEQVETLGRDLGQVGERAASIAEREREAAAKRTEIQADMDRLVAEDARLSAMEAKRRELVDLDAVSWELHGHAERLHADRQRLAGQAAGLAEQARAAASSAEGVAADVLAVPVRQHERSDPEGAKALAERQDGLLARLEATEARLLDQVAPALERLSSGPQAEQSEPSP